MMKGYCAHVAVLFVVLSMGFIACRSQQETAQAPAQSPPSEADVKMAIQRYIEEDTTLKGGFLLKDSRNNQVLMLSFDHVHEAVHAVEDSVYSACVDFKDTAGNLYDVDVYVKAHQGKPTKLVLHKINGNVVSPE